KTSPRPWLTNLPLPPSVICSLPVRSAISPTPKIILRRRSRGVVSARHCNASSNGVTRLLTTGGPGGLGTFSCLGATEQAPVNNSALRLAAVTSDRLLMCIEFGLRRWIRIRTRRHGAARTQSVIVVIRTGSAFVGPDTSIGIALCRSAPRSVLINIVVIADNIDFRHNLTANRSRAVHVLNIRVTVIVGDTCLVPLAVIATLLPLDHVGPVQVCLVLIGAVEAAMTRPVSRRITPVICQCRGRSKQNYCERCKHIAHLVLPS